VSLNIEPGDTPPRRAARKADGLPDTAPTGATPSAALDRDAVIAELVGEMTSWSPKDRVHVFRSWLKGSLSLIHLHVLTVLEMGGPLPMSKLADTLDVSVASATGIVSRMEERTLVERQHDSDDRRVVLVIPTETGLAVFRDMMEQRQEHLAVLLGKLADDDLRAFLQGLRAVKAAREELHAQSATTSTEEPGGTP
jgi:DNA-binding MarR family transcriptional regulator